MSKIAPIGLEEKKPLKRSLLRETGADNGAVGNINIFNPNAKVSDNPSGCIFGATSAAGTNK